MGQTVQTVDTRAEEIGGYGNHQLRGGGCAIGLTETSACMEARESASGAADIGIRMGEGMGFASL